MNKPDASTPPDWLLLAEWLDSERHPYGGDTIRALAAERDALRDDLLTLETCQAKVIAERDRLAAENARLRGALSDLMTWFPDRPSAPEWRLPGGKYGADEAVAAARETLGQKEPNND
jgi:hypothetical protein